jgi:RNA polymerase sigma-70 factor (ECF subfamily)
MTEAERERRRRFDALFRENIAGIASYCSWRSGSMGDEQDAVSEVFLIAWRRLDDVPEGGAARPWLYAAARRVIANQTRANARRAKLSEKLTIVASTDAGAVQHTDDPVAALVHDVLRRLGPRDREVLLLAEWEALSPAEIAKVLRCPAVTARGRLHRARRRFRKAYDASSSPNASASVVVEPSGGTPVYVHQLP